MLEAPACAVIADLWPVFSLRLRCKVPSRADDTALRRLCGLRCVASAPQKTTGTRYGRSRSADAAGSRCQIDSTRQYIWLAA